MSVLVLDANILMRAVLGKIVRKLLAEYGSRIEFVAPDVAFGEARKHLPRVIARKNLTGEPFMEYFTSLADAIRMVDWEAYAPFEAIARTRLARHDEDD